jgi:peptidoglycan LD-endopeptidase LytH
MRRALIPVGLVAFLSLAIVAWLNLPALRDRWTDWTQPLSPHARYARALERAGLHETALGRDWMNAAERAFADARPVRLPYTAEGTFDMSGADVASWQFAVRRGQRLEVDVVFIGDARVFIDVFELDGPERRRVAGAAEHGRTVRHELSSDARYVLRVQTELLRGGQYTVRQRAIATLQFPVEGADAGAVRSTFGDERDRGRREHEGIDIFAPKGTAAVAASDGWVTGVTTNRLGGKVVWVWDPTRGQALYYAHLDRQEVAPGERVRAGDVVGRVGNTGNARATPAHLHFGIYRPLEGAIDPLPFVCDAPCGT